MIQETLNVAAFESTITTAQEASTMSQASKINVKVFKETISKAQEHSGDDSRIQVEKNGQVRPSASRTLGAVNHKQQGSGAGAATYTRNTSFVRPSLSDFVADVELTARRILTKDEFHYFKNAYLVLLLVLDKREELGKGATVTTFDEFADGDNLPEDAARLRKNFVGDNPEDIREYDRNIRERVGAEFIKVGLHPNHTYLKGQDVRDRMSEEKKRDRWVS